MSVLNFLHEKWDDKLGETFVNTLCENLDLFSPRSMDLVDYVDSKICDFFYNTIAEGDSDYLQLEDIEWHVEGVAKKDLTPAERDKVKKYAEYIYNYINSPIEVKRT